jgi:tripartite-type tricarboxylate transporter receptor subunit TctC
MRILLAAVLIASLAVRAHGEEYPSRPITIVVPFPAGGPIDILARFIAERMRPSLGQPIIVENTSGAAGSIGVGRVARAAADGYTLVEGIWSTHVVNPVIYKLQYDVLDDFEPVALLANSSQLIVARRTMPADDLKDLIAWLKNADRVLAGTAGVGSPQHVLGILFQNATGIRSQFVHYRGGAPATQDLVAGQIDIIVADQPTALPQIRARNIKAYAFTGRKRLAAAPDVPTAHEAGLPEFYTSVWNAVWAPKGTPQHIISRLNAAMVAALAEEETRQRLAELGHEVVPRDEHAPEKLRALHKAEIEKWWPIIRAMNIKAD